MKDIANTGCWTSACRKAVAQTSALSIFTRHKPSKPLNWDHQSSSKRLRCGRFTRQHQRGSITLGLSHYGLACGLRTGPPRNTPRRVPKEAGAFSIRWPRQHRRRLASAATGEGEGEQNKLGENRLSRSDSVFEEALLTLERVSCISLPAHLLLNPALFTAFFC